MIQELQLPVAPKPESFEQDALPVCLAPWLENPYRPVSLLDIMIQFSAEMFFWSGCALETLATECIMKFGLGKVSWPAHNLLEPLDDRTKIKASKWLESVYGECAKVGVAVSAETVTEAKTALDSDRTCGHRTVSPPWHLRASTRLARFARRGRGCPSAHIPGSRARCDREALRAWYKHRTTGGSAARARRILVHSSPILLTPANRRSGRWSEWCVAPCGCIIIAHHRTV